MQIHQSANSIGGKIYNAFSYRDHGWGTHIHKCYELVLVKNGTLTATLNGEKLMVKKGEALLIPPYFLHSFSKNTDCTYLIIVFSANYVPSFDNKLKNLQSENHIINFIPRLCISSTNACIFGIFASLISQSPHVLANSSLIDSVYQPASTITVSMPSSLAILHS